MPHRMPDTIVHADWSANAKKRYAVFAQLDPNHAYRISAPNPVGPPDLFLRQLKKYTSDRGVVLAGFDFPIGLPYPYARLCGVDDFLELLPTLGHDIWQDFYRVSEEPSQIHLHRPFYPSRPGGARQADLLRGLGMVKINDLRRECEWAKPDRRAAAPLFWTLGGQQVGKAAICGWRDLLSPAQVDPEIPLKVWPFSGKLQDLTQDDGLIMLETYPAEFYGQLSLDLRKVSSASEALENSKTGSYGKRVQASRMNAGRQLIDWGERVGVEFELALTALIQSGFGPMPEAEDPFDALVGCIGMINVVLGYQPLYEPDEPHIRKVEGWIFGQAKTNPV